jgi:hypothetical protein
MIDRPVGRAWPHDPSLLAASHFFANDWWEAMLMGVGKKVQRTRSGRLHYITWNVWKERNRRISNAVCLTYWDIC